MSALYNQLIEHMEFIKFEGKIYAYLIIIFQYLVSQVLKKSSHLIGPFLSGAICN